MEFALLAIPLFILLLGVLEVGYDLFVQAALDSAVSVASRSIQVGTTQGTAAETNAQIVAAVCPQLGGLLECSHLVVGVVKVPTDYYTTPVSSLITYSGATSSSGGGVCTGTGGSLEALVAWYNGPTFLGLLVPAFAKANPSGSGYVHQTYSSAAFVNEYFSGGQTC